MRNGAIRTVLVTGGNGQLGTELQRHRWPEGWRVEAIDVAELDLTDTQAIAGYIAQGDYAAVINGAAYTAVDRAESDQVTAWAVNALAPAAFAQGCKGKGIPLVQVSTDYVFDGSKADGWRPDDPTGPLNVYGASKLGGELAVRVSGAVHAIVRTSWVVSAHGANFVKTMLRLAGERDALSVVDDQLGAPTGARDLAAALATVAVDLTQAPEKAGTYHFSNAGETSWAGLAEAIFAGSARRGGPTATVTGIPTSAYPTPARRPSHSRLDHQAFAVAFHLTPRPWQAALDDILDDLIGQPR